MTHFTAVAAIIMSLSASIAIAAEETGLTWSSRVVTVNAAIGAEEVEGSFVFTNATDEPVTILSVLTGCGCTVAKLDKKTYAPGESGELNVTFDGEGRSGVHTKHITVRSAAADHADDDGEADGDAKPAVFDLGGGGDKAADAAGVSLTTLTFKVSIPQPLELRPRMVYWRPGEPRTPRTVQIKVVHDEPLKVFLQPQVDESEQGEAANQDGATAQTASSSDELQSPISEPAPTHAFQRQLEEVEPGRLYRLTITPPAAGPAAREIVGLHTDLTTTQPRTATIVARVIGDRPDAHRNLERSLADVLKAE